MKAINPSTKRNSVLAALVLGLAWLPALADGPGNGDKSFDHGRRPSAGFGHYYSPQIEVFADPASEHWPGNYRPDSYHLDGYDGKSDRPTVCAGRTGQSWSTGSRECPPGQKKTKPGRQWSTSP